MQGSPLGRAPSGVEMLQGQRQDPWGQGTAGPRVAWERRSHVTCPECDNGSKDTAMSFFLGNMLWHRGKEAQ